MWLVDSVSFTIFNQTNRLTNALLHLSHCKQESITELPFCAKSTVSIYMHIQCDANIPIQGVSAVDQYNYSVSMISSSCPLSVCGRRAGAGGEGERAQERRDGSRMEGGRFQSQQRLREMFLQSWNTHFHYTHTYTTWQEGTDLDSDRDKEWVREWMCVFTCGVRRHSVTGSITPELCYCTRLTVLWTGACLADKDSWWHLKEAVPRADTDTDSTDSQSVISDTRFGV